MNFPAWDCLPYDRSGPRLKISLKIDIFIKISQPDFKKNNNSNSKCYNTKSYSKNSCGEINFSIKYW